MKSHLLIQEPPLQVLPSLAKAIGLGEAIILQQLHYWINNPKVEGREHDGRKWIFNTYEEWQENFPFWSVQQIQRLFLNLEKGGLVISEKLDAKKHDQRKFYRLDYDNLCTLDESILIPSNISKSDDVNKELHRLPENTIDDNFKHTAYNRGDQERPDKLAVYLQMLEAPGIKKAVKIDNALSYLAERLHRKTHTKEWETFAKQIVNDEQEHGWKLDKFVDWLLSQENYKPEFFPVWKMMEFYPSAFVEDAPKIEATKIDHNGVPETY